MAALLDGVGHSNHALATEIVSLPERIRGIGHVEAKGIGEAGRRETGPPERLRAAAGPPDAAIPLDTMAMRTSRWSLRWLRNPTRWARIR